MGAVNMLDGVMSAFKAPTNYARYYFTGGVDHAQRFADGLTQGKLRGFGLDGFLEVGEPNPEQPVISFGSFGKKVNAPALFQRLDLLFKTGRLPETRRAEASIAMPNAGHTYILTLFGALKAAGAELSSHLHPVFTKPKPNEGVFYSPQSGTSRGMLIATIEQNDVKLTCRAEVTCQQAAADSFKIGPLTIKEFGDGMSFEASLPRHGLTMMGHQVLEGGLRSILSPLVEGNAPFSVFLESDSLFVGACGAIKKSYLEEASEAFGIGMDGTVTLPK